MRTTYKIFVVGHEEDN